MLQQVSLRGANQPLSRYVEMVEEGDEVVFTRRGQPVAKLLPIIQKKRQLTSRQQQALKHLLKHMRKGYNLGGEKFDREAAHER
jgi:prevent-host-death family protein